MEMSEAEARCPKVPEHRGNHHVVPISSRVAYSPAPQKGNSLARASSTCSVAHADKRALPSQVSRQVKRYVLVFLDVVFLIVQLLVSAYHGHCPISKLVMHHACILVVDSHR